MEPEAAAIRDVDAAFMDEALDQARAAATAGEVPVGAVVVVGGIVVARAHNERQQSGDPTAHAEVLALRRATHALGTGWRLDDATLYVTLEPCPMCAGALVLARVARVVFATEDPRAGALGSLYHLGADPRLNHELTVATGVGRREAATLLESFFAARRTRVDPL